MPPDETPTKRVGCAVESVFLPTTILVLHPDRRTPGRNAASGGGRGKRAPLSGRRGSGSVVGRKPQLWGVIHTLQRQRG